MSSNDAISHRSHNRPLIWKHDKVVQSGASDEYLENDIIDKDEKNGDWKRKLLQSLRGWWKDDGMFSFSRSKWTMATVAFILAAAIVRYRDSKQKRRQIIKQRKGEGTRVSGTITHSQPINSRSTVPRDRSSWLLLLWKLVSGSQGFHHQKRKIVDVSLSMLRLAARKGLVQKAVVGSGEILFQDRHSGDKSAWKRSQLPPNSPGVQADLLELLSNNGCEEVSALPESLTSRLAGPILAALPFVYLAMVYKIFKNIHNGGNDMKVSIMSKSTSARFSDVAGLEPVLPEVREIVHFLRNAQAYQSLGAKPPRGILLHGSPGTGKTLLARAVAGEANATFLSCSGSEFCEMYVGRGAARVRSLFGQAKNQALQRKQHSWWRGICSLHSTAMTTEPLPPPPPPTAIIFIDEFDAIAKSRSYGGLPGNDERESTLNQLLTEMDGFGTSKDGVKTIIIAATNRVDVLDPAILRRFDRKIHVPYPDASGRRDIMLVHVRSINCNLEDIDWDLLASDPWTNQFSGSDLRNVINDAALLAVRGDSPQVQQQHLEQAIKRCKAMKTKADLGGIGERFFDPGANKY